MPQQITINPQYLVDSKGRKRQVLLSIKEYEELLDLALDAVDVRSAPALRKEQRHKWSDVKQAQARDSKG